MCPKRLAAPRWKGLEKCLVLSIWAAISLLLASYHEPWRDEAQAWQVAKSATGLKDLALRSARESNGPVYYLLLWPWAQIFNHFPSTLFYVSWFGTFCAVGTLIFLFPLPRICTYLLLVGYFFSYEYSAIARLYGWGCLFMLHSILADLKNRTIRGTLWFALATFTQLNFVYALVGWCVHVLIQRKISFSQLGLRCLCISMLGLFLSLGIDLSQADLPYARISLERIGSTGGAPFLHGPLSLRTAGVFVLCLFTWALPRSVRWPFFMGLIPYLVTFTLLYKGEANTRHAGPLFLLWIILIHIASAEKRKGKILVVLSLLLSVVSAFLAGARDVRQVFSDGLPVAQIIEKSRDPKKPLKLYVASLEQGMVVASRLGVVPCGPLGALGFPFFNEKNHCNETCPSGESIYYVGIDSPPRSLFENRGEWGLLYSRTDTIIPDESLSLHRLHCQ